MSKMLEAGHEMAMDLFEVGIIDAAKMREFDAMSKHPSKKKSKRLPLGDDLPPKKRK